MRYSTDRILIAEEVTGLMRHVNNQLKRIDENPIARLQAGLEFLENHSKRLNYLNEKL